MKKVFIISPSLRNRWFKNLGKGVLSRRHLKRLRNMQMSKKNPFSKTRIVIAVNGAKDYTSDLIKLFTKNQLP